MIISPELWGHFTANARIMPRFQRDDFSTCDFGNSLPTVSESPVTLACKAQSHTGQLRWPRDG